MFDGFEVIAYRKCWVEKKGNKRRKDQFSESAHCNSPTPPIARLRPKKNVLKNI